jgi:hypothetical protein
MIDPILWLIAVGGAAIHIMMKVAEIPENTSILKGFSRKDKFVTIASFIAIPVIMIIMTDTSLKELLPLNYITAFLTGYQTQSMLRTLTNIFGKKHNLPTTQDGN